MFPQQAWKTVLTANDATAQEAVGSIRVELDSTYGARAYRYVQAAADTTVANGTALAYSDAYKFVATSDISDADVNQPLGVGVGAITAEYYGWVQVLGYHSAVKTNGDDDIADGASIILGADGVFDSVPSGTASSSKRLGVAVAADIDAANTVAVQLDCIF